MRKPYAIFLMAILAGSVGCAPKTPVDTSAQDVAAIKALEDRFVTAFNAKDIDSIMALYTPGDDLIVFDAIPPRQFTGWAAYKKDWEGVFASMPGAGEMKLTELDITVGGNVAYSHSIQTSTFTDKSGKKQQFIARVTDGYKKVNGVWLISHEHVSVPVDMATLKAVIDSK